jgi:hypothetical protein
LICWTLSVPDKAPGDLLLVFYEAPLYLLTGGSNKENNLLCWSGAESIRRPFNFLPFIVVGFGVVFHYSCFPSTKKKVIDIICEQCVYSCGTQEYFIIPFIFEKKIA